MRPGKPDTILKECRALLTLASPMVIAQLAQIGTGVVDTIMAGHYSSGDLAAIAIGYNIWLPIYLFFIGVMLGATYIIAQHFGAGRTAKIRDSLPQSLWLALGLGLLGGPLCYFAGPLLELLDLDPVTQAKSLAYLRAVAFGLPAAAVFEALRCHNQGIGVMRPFAIASVLGFVANIPLNYALMYGRWGMPELGAAGCGWATTGSMCLSAAALALLMKRAPQLQPWLPRMQLVRPRLDVIGEIVRLGLPLGCTLFVEVAFFSVIALCIATLGDIAVAAHQIAFNMWDVVYMPLISFGSALAVRVGHAIGAGDRAALRLSIACGTSMTVMVGLLGMTLLLSSPAGLVSLYTNDPDIAVLAISLVRLAALFIAIDSAQVAASYCLRAFRDTRFAFFALCLAYWLITLPLGYWRGIVTADNAYDGTIAFWQSLIAGITVVSLLVFLRLYRTLRKPLS
ncbi:MAG: MATE family efflux transporter [Pseudomonadales bacterium]|nr:MATE family efflux transporter [Halioglobus sp.]MCP5131528.1 MATE family efflux transporter [Pseudomonadales bacterium]